jgi:hypothetical protein
MVTNFVNRKHGREAIAKMHPLVDELLAPTYGVVVYQEQVMQIAQALAGYSLGGADLLRRAMGKKKPEEMAKQKSVFVDGARSRGVEGADAEHIFGLLEYFAGYGFNKSHSAAYALMTYQTAYLKAHYPVELLCAIMTSDKDKIDKVVRTIADARAIGVTVLPPDLNESDTDFKVVFTHPNGDRKFPRSARVEGRKAPFVFGHVTIRAGLRFASGSALCAASGARRSRRCSRRGARGGRSSISSISPRGSTRRRSTRASSRRSSRAGRSTDLRRSRGEPFARVRVHRHRARAIARGEPRSRSRADEPVRPVRRGDPSQER